MKCKHKTAISYQILGKLREKNNRIHFFPFHLRFVLQHPSNGNINDEMTGLVHGSNIAQPPKWKLIHRIRVGLLRNDFKNVNSTRYALGIEFSSAPHKIRFPY